MKQLNYNYIKENSKVFDAVIFNTLDRISVKNTETHNEYKNTLVRGYISFLYNLNYLRVETHSPLYKHIQYSLSLFTICDKIKRDSYDTVFSNDYVKPFISKLNEHIKDWLDNDLDTVLKEFEKEFYTSIAYQKEEMTSVFSTGRIKQLKEKINTDNHKFNLG